MYVNYYYPHNTINIGTHYVRETTERCRSKSRLVQVAQALATGETRRKLWCMMWKAASLDQNGKLGAAGPLQVALSNKMRFLISILSAANQFITLFHGECSAYNLTLICLIWHPTLHSLARNVSLIILRYLSNLTLDAIIRSIRYAYRSHVELPGI